MKRLFIILCLLCAWGTSSVLCAQIHSFSSATYRSYSSGGLVDAPVTSSFRTTSLHIQQTPIKVNTTAPMHVANGTITTVASQLSKGKLADDQSYMPTIRDRRNTLAPPSEEDGGTEEYLPLTETWDLWLFMVLILSLYAFLRKTHSCAKD